MSFKNSLIFLSLTMLLGVMSCDTKDEQPTPVVSGFSPERGMPGAIVTVTGENFGTSSADVNVTLGGVDVIVSSVTNTTLVFTVAENSVTGKIAVSVGEKEAISTNSFEVFNTPTIGSFTPESGVEGTTVTITGTNFSDTPTENEVEFSGVSATIQSSTSTSIVTTVPEGAITGKIAVTTNELTATSSQSFAVPPTIASIAPLTGITGTEVIISGKSFSSIIAENTVLFNGQEATITSASFSSLTVTVPSTATTGAVSIEVLGETVVSADEFVVKPNITAISPIEGPVGTVVTITGSGFSTQAANNTVQFNGVDAVVSQATANELKVNVPTGATTGTITVKVGANTATSDEFKVIIEALGIGGTGFDSGTAIGVDSDGNYYVGGVFQDPISIGTNTLNSMGLEDAFIAKYNALSELQWIKRLGGASSDRMDDIVVSSSGDIILAAKVGANSDFDGISLNNNQSGVAVIKLSPTGSIVWSEVGTSASSLSSLALDDDQNVLITGRYRGVLSFTSVNVTSTGEDESYVAKLNGSTGAGIWITGVSGTKSVGGNAIATDASGNVFFSGSFFETLTISGTSITSQGGLDSYIGKLNPNGQLIWLKQVAGTEWNNVYGVATDPSGDLVITGYYNGSTDFGGTSVSPIRLSDVFIAKYAAADGALTWVKSIGAVNDDEGHDITISSSGRIYITGHISGTTDFGSKSLQTFGNSNDVFVAELNSSGSFVNAWSGGAGENDNGKALAVDSNGIVHVTGFYRDLTATFGITKITNQSNDDAFVWKIKSGN
tara:strand:- start:980 stop:3322 length:2343 start_codon:yes stop_codon:yes gene_type:complete